MISAPQPAHLRHLGTTKCDDVRGAFLFFCLLKFMLPPGCCSWVKCTALRHKFSGGKHNFFNLNLVTRGRQLCISVHWDCICFQILLAVCTMLQKHSLSLVGPVVTIHIKISNKVMSEHFELPLVTGCNKRNRPPFLSILLRLSYPV